MSNSSRCADPRAAWPDLGPPRLRHNRPLTLVLGGGAVRGLTHVGVLEALTERGLKISEIVGTSVGALILAFYAAAGLDLPAIRRAGLSLKSRHLLAWALLRHAPAAFVRPLRACAGEIPGFMQLLGQSSFAHLHHGVQLIGIVAYDLLSREEIVCHSAAPGFRLEDAVRGSVALPGLFPAWACSSGGRNYRLQDGGVINRLPVDVALRPPFRPAQILAVDISTVPHDREKNLAKIVELRRGHRDVPIDVICADTLGGAGVVYATGYLPRLLEAGRRSALEYLSQVACHEPSAPSRGVAGA